MSAVMVSLEESKSMSILEGSIYNRMSTLMVSLEESIGLLVLKESIWNRVFISMISLKESMSMSVLEGSIQSRLSTMMSSSNQCLSFRGVHMIIYPRRGLCPCRSSSILTFELSLSLFTLINTMLVQMCHWVRVKVVSVSRSFSQVYYLFQPLESTECLHSHDNVSPRYNVGPSMS